MNSTLRLSAILFALSLALACRAPSDRRLPGRAAAAHLESAQRWCEEVDSTRACTMYGPSLLTLIARPEMFDGNAVRVIGYVHFQFEDNGLYLSQESYEHGVSRNGLWIDPPPGFVSDSASARRQPNDQYVIVEGTFNAQDQGHLGLWSGALEHVTRLEAWSPSTTPQVKHVP